MVAKNYTQRSVGPDIEFGKGGSRIKEDSGAISHRNNADSDYVVVRGADPVGDQDFVTKGYFARSGGTPVTGQIDGTSPPAASPEGALFVCTTDSGGGSYDLNKLYRVESAAWVEVGPVEGQTIAVTDDLTGGTVTFDGDHVYVWDEDGTQWLNIGPSTSGASKTISQRTVSLAHTDSGANNIGAAVPAGAKVLRARVNVTQVFDGATPTIQIGDAVDPDRLLTADESDLEEAVLFVGDCEYTYGTSTQLTATLSVSGASQGLATVTIEFANA